MHFINTLLSCGAFPIITKPTRVTGTTATIIDHIITNVTNHKILPRVIETSEISDNYPIFCQVQNITLPRKIIILLVTIETNLNLILLHLITTFTML